MSNDQNEPAGIRDGAFPGVDSSPSATPKRLVPNPRANDGQADEPDFLLVEDREARQERAPGSPDSPAVASVPTQGDSAAFVRETDGYGHLPRWTRAEVEDHENLEAAFREWADGKAGTLWWDTETRLADAIACVLNITIDWSDR